MDCWIALVTIVLGFIVLRRYFKRIDRFKEHGIPFIKPLPLVGNMGGILFRQTSFAACIQKIYRADDDAQYVGMYDFGYPVVMLRDPELIKAVTIKHFDHFVDHRGFVDPTDEPLFGKNLFSLRGDQWREIRNLLTPAFTSSKMKGMFKLMLKCSDNFSDFMIEKAQGKPFTVGSKDAFTRYTNDVVATCAFGITIDSMRNPNNEFYVLGRKATNFEGILSMKFFLLRSFPRLSKLFKVKLIGTYVENFFYELVRDTINVRDASGTGRPDMIQLMMETRKNKEGEGPMLTIQDMTAQAFIFFFGGFDTSSSLMCFVGHVIAENDEVQARLQEEVDEVYGKFNGEPTYEAINSMQYLDAIINETLRMHPIAVFLDRICTKSFELPATLSGAKPLTLKPGDSIYIPVYGLHRDPQYFPEPDKFCPDRFLNDKTVVNSPAYLPFGHGPRICIGNRFALLETKVLFFHLIAKCKLSLNKKMILPMQYSTSGFSMTAKGGFWLDLEPRNKWKKV